tara:strand:- start:60 stop:224 length:165 start_codon:yes stop_codon:yes gene_type:complete
VGHDYYDKDEVFNNYIKDMAIDDDDLGLPLVEESNLGPDVLLAVERVNEQVQAA